MEEINTPAVTSEAMAENQAPARRSHAWAFWFLLLLTVIGSLFIILYSLTLLNFKNLNTAIVLIITITEIIQDVLLSAIGAGIGLWLGSKIGLGAPLLEDWLAGKREAGRAFVAGLPLASIAGLVTGIVVLILSIALINVLHIQTGGNVSLPSAWQGLLAAISAGIREEIWMRLGLLTLFAWLGTRIARRERPSLAILWIANTLSALIFASLHFSNAAVVGMSGLGTVLYILLLNGLAGLVFGWIYWRKGILLAMVAHFACDIILHVIPPLLIGKF